MTRDEAVALYQEQQAARLRQHAEQEEAWAREDAARDHLRAAMRASWEQGGRDHDAWFLSHPEWGDLPVAVEPAVEDPAPETPAEEPPAI